MGRKHNTDNYLIGPNHKITVNLIGIGGTGSKMITLLGQLHTALNALNHPGLYVIAWDDEKVSQHNMGRQLFSEADIGRFKSDVMVERINAFFKTEWASAPYRFEEERARHANITISAVDTIKSRLEIENLLIKMKQEDFNVPYDRPLYWLDMGNSKKSGQVILSTPPQCLQDRGVYLPNIFELFPDFRNQDDTNEPSCSIEESLNKQDLFVNNFMATYGAQLLWQLFKQGQIDYQGAFINLETLSTVPIKIKKHAKPRKYPTRKSQAKSVRNMRHIY